MKAESSICIFSRLHPFLNQYHLLENIGGIKDNGTTLYVDLSISEEDQRNRYDKRLNRQIRSLRKMGYVIKEAESVQEIEDFVEMYHKTWIVSMPRQIITSMLSISSICSTKST